MQILLNFKLIIPYYIFTKAIHLSSFLCMLMILLSLAMITMPSSTSKLFFIDAFRLRILVISNMFVKLRWPDLDMAFILINVNICLIFFQNYDFTRARIANLPIEQNLKLTNINDELLPDPSCYHHLVG